MVFGELPEQAVFYCLENCTVIVSEALIDEIIDRLRIKTNAPYRWRRFLRLHLGEICEVISFESSLIGSNVRDPKDLHIITAASEGECDFIITGDKDLLVLGKHKKIQIITPSEFLDLFSAQNN